MARVMYFDCFSGAAGDMILAALIDAGLPVDALRAALGSLGVGQDIEVSRVLRAGLSATHFRVRPPDAPRAPADAEQAHDHHDTHQHGHPHHHHSLHDIEHRIRHAALSPPARDRAIALFRRLAEAEAAVHDMPVERVHLHEVGAVDSIIDVVGAVFAFEWFGIDDIVASPVNVGGGTVEIAHGTFPVPAPATLRLLTGVPVYSRGPRAELLTPTGALLLSSYARTYGPLPEMAIDRVGYGAGSRDHGAAPNVLRVVIGDRVAAAERPGGTEAVLRIECEIDDMNPQLFGPVSDRLFAAGALDVFLTSVQMKKGRPGTLLTVLAPDTAQAAMVNLLFRETTTLGVRYDRVWRETLDRRWETVVVRGGQVRIKVASRAGETLDATPEFDDCVRVADATGRAVRDVQAEAVRAWAERGAAASPIE
jgi:hypothetical protein